MAKYQHELSMAAVLSKGYCEIWENSLLGVLILDKEGMIRYMNRLLILTDDLQDVEIMGKKMVDFYPLSFDCHLTIQTIQTGQPIIKRTIIYYTLKKKLVNSLCSTFPLVSKGRLEGAIHFSLNLQTSQDLIERHQSSDFRPDLPPRPQKKEFYTFDSLIGEDTQFKNAITYAKSASQTNYSAFIWAESGCGKELFAQAIHHASSRSNRPFVPINCAAIPDNLLETTLFGTSKGAFTGAAEKAGLLEEAQGGTILLDELNSMSLELQAKMLRAVQEKKIRRVGALKEIPIDVKYISTCNIPPSQALEENKIRTDLFYRLAVVVLEIPPLRKRTSDIPLLCEHFLDDYMSNSEQASRYEKKTIVVSDTVYQIFNDYPWPGNVRELEHTLKAALSVLQGSQVIEQHHLSAYFLRNVKRLSSKPSSEIQNSEESNRKIFHDLNSTHELRIFADMETALDVRSRDKICLNSTLKNIETMYIQKALIRAGYNISKAGRFLNLSPQALRYKINKLGIHIPNE